MFTRYYQIQMKYEGFTYQVGSHFFGVHQRVNKKVKFHPVDTMSWKYCHTLVTWRFFSYRIVKIGNLKTLECLHLCDRIFITGPKCFKAEKFSRTIVPWHIFSVLRFTEFCKFSFNLIYGVKTDFMFNRKRRNRVKILK